MSVPRVAVVTGHHPFDVLGFHAMFRSLPEADFYIQHMEDFAYSSSEARAGYDVVLFYNMHTETPTGEGSYYDRGIKAALEPLGQTEQGILLLHHAILAFPDWPLWSDIVGIWDRRFEFYHDESIHVEVANPEHPITHGLDAFDMVDETYAMADAGDGSEILLTTQHPRSMRTLAWTRQYKKARVFCLESGHDNSAFAHPLFRTLVSRGIAWCASRI
jgi:uncharacterized protein